MGNKIQLETVVARKYDDNKSEVKANNIRGFNYGLLKLLPKTGTMRHKMDIYGDEQFYNKPGHKSGRIKGYLVAASLYTATASIPAAAAIAYLK